MYVFFDISVREKRRKRVYICFRNMGKGSHAMSNSEGQDQTMQVDMNALTDCVDVQADLGYNCSYMSFSPIFISLKEVRHTN